MQKEENNCAIGRDNSFGSCFTLEELHNIAHDYNNSSKDKIKLYSTKKDMLIALKEKLTECSEQTCWPTLKFIKNQEVINTCLNKFLCNEFKEKLEEPYDKFVSWFMS